MAGETGSTLFHLLEQPDDEQAWRRFDQRYRPLLMEWCSFQHLQQVDGEEVAQEVLCRLIRALRSYDRKRGRFRPWLKAVARHVWCDIRKQQAKTGLTLGNDFQPLTGGRNEDVDASFQTFVDRIVDIELFERAAELVQLRVEPKTWEVFREVCLEERSAKEVADKHDLSLSGAYQATYRVKQIMQDVIRCLEEKGNHCERNDERMP